jgi:tetratricopeptide (TPR) repeat protein/tRNA A-37 threonylcarbamoyl transferase component Bud32
MAELQPLTNPDRAAESLSGTTIGRFVIGDRLGKGGMGEVYLAQDTKLKRQVALKRLAPSLRADALYRRRFQEEAERASRFSDAHVAALYDVLEDNGEMFLVMEYIEGENLRQRLRRPLTLEQFFDIALQSAEALAAAHERGIVHCDIKPENIMLTSAGQVKILDFGVAKHLPRSDQSSTVDRTGSVGGTPAYMSPEVLLEKIPDGRADVFSLGVVFYEALTGHHPFLASSFVATTDRIRGETPAPIRIFNSHVPDGLEALVSKAMAKEPGQRYASARELLQDLRLVQAGLTPTKLQPVLPMPFVRKPTRWAIALLAVLLVAAVVFAFYYRAQSTPILSERGWVLVGDFESRGDDPIPDAGVREGLTIALQQSRYVNVFPRSRVYDTLQRMKKPEGTRVDEGLGREICQRENLQVLLTGSIEHVGKTYQITLQALDPVRGNLLFAERERFDNKEQFFDKADALAKQVRKDLGESMGGIEKTSRPLAKVTTSSLEALQLYSQAKDAVDQGKQDQALTPLQGALKLDPGFAMAHLRLAEYYGAIVSKNQQVVAEARRAYELRGGVTDREKLWIEAHYFLVQERYEDAVQSLSVLVNLYPDDLDYHLALADAYDGVARPDKTIEELRQILRLNPLSVSAYAQLVQYLARINANDEAIATYQQARQHGIETPDLHRGLGLAYLGLGRVTEAQQEFHTVEQAGQLYVDLGEFSLATADLYEGKLASASAHLQSIIQRDQAAHTKGLQLVAHALQGRIYLAMEQPLPAQREAEQILAAPEEDLQTADLVSAGVLYARAGATGPARNVLRRLEVLSRNVPTAWNRASLFTVQGNLALSEKSPQDAIAALVAADNAYPQATIRVALALSYAARQDWAHATGQWQKLLHSQGEILQEGFPPDLALGHLELARLSARLGDAETARSHYEEFLRLWQYSDDLPQRREAGAELLELVRKSQKRTMLREGANQNQPERQ